MNFGVINPKGSISLEPRLQEYLSKKQYYQENNITPTISIEKQFQVTDNDIQRIRDYMRGKQIYSKKNQDRYTSSGSDSNKQDWIKQFAPPMSKEQFDDKRFDKLKLKQQKDKDALACSRQYNFYEDVHNTKITNQNDGIQRLPDTGQPYFLNNGVKVFLNNGFYEDVNSTKKLPDTEQPHFLENNFDNKYKIKNPQHKLLYNHPPKIQYNQRQYPSQNDDSKKQVNGIIGDKDTYSELNRVMFDLDEDDKRIDTSGYKSVPLMCKDGLKDVNYDNYLRDANPTRGRKSYGYPNPAEHYFTYIDDDMQKPEHTVLAFPRGGESTRLDKNKTARPYVREILQ